MGPFHQHGLAHRSHICQLSKLLVFMMFPAISLLLFPLFHSNSPLVVRFWGLFGRFFEGSASVFLLLNGVVVSIIASSKMEQSTARGASSGARDEETLSDHEGGRHIKISTENQPASEEVRHEIETAVGDENQESQDIIEENFLDNQGGQQNVIVAPGCSCDDHEENKPLMEKAGQDDDNGQSGQEDAASTQMSPTRSGYGGGAGHVGGVGNAPPSKEEAPSATEVWAAIVAAKNRDLLQAGRKPLDGPHENGNEPGNSSVKVAMKVERAGDGKRAGNPAPSKEEALSAEEVWAAIMSGETGGKASDKSKSNGGVDAAARRRISKAGQPQPAAAWRSRSSPAADRSSRAEVEEGKGEVEELNRRAEEFIARFNERMRLQRLESLRRRRAQRRGGHRLQRHPAAAAAAASKGPSHPPQPPRAVVHRPALSPA